MTAVLALLRDAEPSLYVYRMETGSHGQTGIAACFSVDSTRLFRPILSLSVDLRIALRTPLSIQARCVRARAR